MSARQLETWRGQRLLPRPERVGQDGLRPVWLSPPSTGQQLLRLCELRRDRDTRDPSRLRVLLWLAGVDQPLNEVRSDLRDILTQVGNFIEHELDKVARTNDLAGDPASVRRQAINLLADEAAGLRRAKTVLRRLRSSDGHRRPGLRVLLHLFVTGQAPHAELGTADDLERSLGVLPRGRLDRVNQKTTGVNIESAGPWHDGQPADLDSMAAVMSLPALRHAVDRATDADLVFARRAVAPLTGGLAFLSRLSDAFTKVPNFAGLTLFRDARKGAAFTEPMLVALVISLRHSDHADNLIAVVEAAEQVRKAGRNLLDSLLTAPGSLLRQRMSQGDRRQGRRVERVLNEFGASSDTTT